MTVNALLSNLTARGVEFEVHGDKLGFGPAELLTDGEFETVCQQKKAIIAMLVAAPATRQSGWPIVPGHEHFSLWVDSADGPLPEFIPSYHHDARQSSQLRTLCSRPDVE